MIGPSTDTADLVGDTPSPGNEFDLDTALELLRLSLQAYQMLIDSNNGQTFTLPAPYELIITFLTGESFLGSSLEQAVPIAFIATANNNIYVVFRGTVTIDEWISDADFPFVPYTNVSNGGMTEMGFTDIYEGLGIVDEVNSLSSMGDYDNVFITGHSLGAALAGLALPDIAVNTDFNDPVIYSFASPRVGDSDFKSRYDGFDTESRRVYNTNDEVPKLPPSALGYVHVNTGFPITFGNPVSGPFDFKDIAFNHEACNYYNTLCGMTDDPDTCMAMADGADGCNAGM
jgi:triacylglycerol lipase